MLHHLAGFEAAIRSEYGIDLAHALWAEHCSCPKEHDLGLRKVIMLMNGLPSDSALHRSMMGGAAWTTQHELTATLAELVDINNRMFLQANSKKGTKAPKPINIRRPYEPEKKTKRKTMSEVAAELKSLPGALAVVPNGGENN